MEEIDEGKTWYIETYGITAWEEYLEFSEMIDRDYPTGWIYFIQWGLYTKIGMTMKDPVKRALTTGVLMPFEPEFKGGFHSDRTREIEKYLHFTFRNRRSNGEWFILTESEYQKIRQFGELESAYCPWDKEMNDPTKTFLWRE